MVDILAENNFKVTRKEKLTSEKWLNLFRAEYEYKKTHGVWIYASRRLPERPVEGVIDAVIIVPVIPCKTGNKVILASQFRVPIGMKEYSFPAGLLESGEAVEKCARRELLEETGYEVKKVTQISPTIYSSSGLTDENCVMIFCTTGAKPVKAQELDEAEDITVEVMDLDAVKALCKRKDVAISAKTWPVLNMYQIMGEIR